MKNASRLRVKNASLAEVRNSLRINWYRCPVEPATLRRLMQRSDLQGWLQAGGHCLE